MTDVCYEYDKCVNVGNILLLKKFYLNFGKHYILYVTFCFPPVAAGTESASLVMSCRG